jgi:cytoskeletal protein RodZ
MRRRPIAVALLPFALLACGDDDSASTATTATTATAAAATTSPTTVPETTSAPATTDPATTAPPPTTAAPPPPTTHSGVVEITVDADTAAAAPMAESVALGEQVRITVRTATAQEFHLHGYDIDGSGTEVVFDFTADLPGEFVLESHDTGAPLLTLTVA